jgi:hypothetical protein
MSRYKDWMLQQAPEFIAEVCGDSSPLEKFKDIKFKSITLEELMQLDTKYILSQSVTDN